MQNPASQQTPGNWGQNRRLQFIDYRLRWDGQLNRSDLTAFFNTSVPQASLDLARYLDAAADNLDYDKSTRSYVATADFKPLFAGSSARRYLTDLLSLTTGVTEPSMSFVGWRPNVDAAPRPGRGIDESILVALVRAMRRRQRVAVCYQSMSRPEPTERALSPHALAFDGWRWHVRAYCHLRERFRDFVLARMLSLRELEEPAAAPDTDSQWNQHLPVVLSPHPDLPEAAQRALELDYGMNNGEVTMQCRHAMLFYALRNLRLERADVGLSASTQQVILKNRDFLEPFLAEVYPRSE